MRRLRIALWCLGLVVAVTALSLSAGRLWAKDPAEENEVLTDDEMAVRTEGAHHFLLPKDWPVERRDGHLSPFTVEAYLSMKFGQVKRKFSETDQHLKALEQRVVELEQEQNSLLKWMRLMEARQQTAQQDKEATHGDATQVPEAESPQAPSAP